MILIFESSYPVNMMINSFDYNPKCKCHMIPMCLDLSLNMNRNIMLVTFLYIELTASCVLSFFNIYYTIVLAIVVVSCYSSSSWNNKYNIIFGFILQISTIVLCNIFEKKSESNYMIFMLYLVSSISCTLLYGYIYIVSDYEDNMNVYLNVINKNKVPVKFTISITMFCLLLLLIHITIIIYVLRLTPSYIGISYEILIEMFTKMKYSVLSANIICLALMIYIQIYNIKHMNRKIRLYVKNDNIPINTYNIFIPLYVGTNLLTYTILMVIFSVIIFLLLFSYTTLYTICYFVNLVVISFMSYVIKLIFSKYLFNGRVIVHPRLYMCIDFVLNLIPVTIIYGIQFSIMRFLICMISTVMDISKLDYVMYPGDIMSDNIDNMIDMANYYDE